MERKVNTRSKLSTRQITIIGMLSAICIVLGSTGIGFIPIPPFNATIFHVPVIIGAIIEGPIVGAILGLFFGVFSIINAIAKPNPTSFVFLNPIISILPRILIGVFSYYAFKLTRTKFNTINIGIAAAIGSLTNTIFVLGLMYLIYVDSLTKILKISASAIRATLLTIGATSGIPEMILSIIVTVPVVTIINKIRK